MYKACSRMSRNSRTRNVGMGSSDDDLTRDDMMSRRTSLSEQGRKDASEDVAETNAGGGDRPVVSDRTASISRAKNVAKPSAVWSVV